jgi:hypothetical protein
MIKILKPTDSLEPLVNEYRKRSVFLAGSIEMGTAAKWQDEVIQSLTPATNRCEGFLLNPRCDQWTNHSQSKDNPPFVAQVKWEMRGIGLSDTVAFYFDPNTRAPITLFELGWCLASGKSCIVCCPGSYWRKGNVDIYCDAHHDQVTQVKTLDDLCKAVANVYINKP